MESLLNKLENVNVDVNSQIDKQLLEELNQGLTNLLNNRLELQNSINMLKKCFNIDNFNKFISWQERREIKNVIIANINTAGENLIKCYKNTFPEFLEWCLDKIKTFYNFKINHSLAERVYRLKDTKYIIKEEEEGYGEDLVLDNIVNEIVEIVVDEIPDLENEALAQHKKYFLESIKTWRNEGTYVRKIVNNKLSIDNFFYARVSWGGKYEASDSTIRIFNTLEYLLDKFYNTSNNDCHRFYINRGHGVLSFESDFYESRDIRLKLYKNGRCDIIFPNNENVVNFCKFVGIDKFKE
jgi:hypothetical protein